MSFQIREALSHGVNVFIYDWYWYDDRPFLENCLNDGFLKADNCRDMKFYLMWANHDANYTWDKRLSGRENAVVWRGAVTEEQFRKIARRWIEKYFVKDNYYKIDGRPVISIYEIKNFVEGVGGIEKAKECLAFLDEECRLAGFDGVHVQFVKWGNRVVNLSGVDGGVQAVTPSLIKGLGFSSLTHYQYVHFADVRKDYIDLLDDVKNEYDAIERTYDIPYFPHASIGWDNNPRFIDRHGPEMQGNTPENFEKALRLAKEYAEKNGAPLITVNSWNEWTETSYLEPDDLYGYGYLDAIKEVFL